MHARPPWNEWVHMNGMRAVRLDSGVKNLNKFNIWCNYKPFDLADVYKNSRMHRGRG